MRPSLLRRLGRRLRWWQHLSGRHRWTDRSRGARRLAIVLAGYYPDLWPATIERIAASRPDDLDICLVGAGRKAAGVEALAERHGWSCVRSADPQPSLAMNVAVARHPRAELIHKLDEDIVIPTNYWDRLEAGLALPAPFHAEVIAPVLNVNPFSYAIFLDAVGARADYEARFGPARSGLFDCPAYHDGEAAAFLWERSLPLAEADRLVAAAAHGLVAVPTRFCIGAMLLRRTWWSEIGGFRRRFLGPALGVDEEALCFATQNRGRVVAVHSGVFAGHLGFAPQRAVISVRAQSWVAACRP